MPETALGPKEKIKISHTLSFLVPRDRKSAHTQTYE